MTTTICVVWLINVQQMSSVSETNPGRMASIMMLSATKLMTSIMRQCKPKYSVIH